MVLHHYQRHTCLNNSFSSVVLFTSAHYRHTFYVIHRGSSRIYFSSLVQAVSEVERIPTAVNDNAQYSNRRAGESHHEALNLARRLETSAGREYYEGVRILQEASRIADAARTMAANAEAKASQNVNVKVPRELCWHKEL